MQNTETKTNNSVKSKLVAAIAMLLVATIMVVSSTYAWFTLSTKPEVTGISTAVGANGALEMLLATKDANGSWVYHDDVVDANATDDVRNTYWGNLVKISDEYYGSNMITLYPAKLNETADGVIEGTPISYPEYGADGRVNALEKGGLFGLYNGSNFFEDTENYGFRAIGMASGMTARQQSFNVALAQIAVNQSTAKAEARQSLAENGNQLAAIAVKKGMNTSEQYDATDFAAVVAMAEGIEKSLTALEIAYLEALYAAVYSSLNGTENDDVVATQISTIKEAADAETALGEKIKAAIAKVGNAEISGKLEGYSDFEQAVVDYNTAKTSIDALAESGDLDTLITALKPLVDVNAVQVNGYAGSEISSKKDEITSSVLKNGVKVHIGDEGGVYGTVAKLCGKYNVSIDIDAASISTSLSGTVPADLTVGDSETPTLNTVRSVLSQLKPSKTGATNPLSEFYGYVIDLAFRTNAANSNLLLQTTAADRIYEGNQNEETLGKGSTMTFNTDFALFTEEQMKKLMEHITLVFFESNNTTEGMKIIKKAKLDAENAQKVDDGLEANIYLLDGDNFITKQEDAVIQAMNTNEKTHVSVLVYLDGETLTNADVAATLAQSMYGKLNLQFASSADLVPMDYADLHHTTEQDDAQG